MKTTILPELPIEILPSNISDAALTGIIENFILREGTDYGIIEVSYDAKVDQIRRQISDGEIKIIFDQSSETVSLLSKRDFQRLRQAIKEP